MMLERAGISKGGNIIFESVHDAVTFVQQGGDVEEKPEPKEEEDVQMVHLDG